MPGSVIVVGGGPAGVLLTYLLARGGVAVTLLESRNDFARRFRGDTIAPGVLRYLDVLGLAEPLLAELPHTRVSAFRWHTPTKTYTLADYRRPGEYGYYALISQSRFLPWLAGHALSHGARVEMGARFSSLLYDASGRVCGVEYSKNGTSQTLTADLIVAADGRNSKARKATGLKVTELGASLDILWVAMPREPEDPQFSGLDLFAAPGLTLALLDQGGEQWQLGLTIPAGTWPKLRTAGIQPLVTATRDALPFLTDRLTVLRDPNQFTLLPVRITTVERWTEPGLLLIGDAAHVISPVGGNGINFALADAAETANRLIEPLLADPVDRHSLDAAARQVEEVRRPPVDREQRAQRRTESNSARALLRRDPRPPAFLRLTAHIPGLAWILGRTPNGLQIPEPPSIILSQATRRSGATGSNDS